MSPQTWLWGGTLVQLHYDLAVGYARLAAPDLAFKSLEESVACGWRDAQWLASDPELQQLRVQAGFRTLQENLGSLPRVELQPTVAMSAP